MTDTEFGQRNYFWELARPPTPWHTLVASLWAAITCGFLYTFSTFSTSLKEAFGLSEAELATVGSGQLAVGFVTFSTGLVADRLGVSACLLLGAALNSGSWLAFGMVAMWGVRVPFVPPCYVFAALAGSATYGAACVTAAVFSVITKNFKEERAAALGIAKAWVGVSAGIATTVYVGFFPSADSDPARLHYIWFLAAACAFFAVVPSPFIRILPDGAQASDGQAVGREHRAGRGLCISGRWAVRLLTALTLCLVAATAASTLLQGVVSAAHKVQLSVLILALLTSPALLLWPTLASTGREGSSPSNLSRAAAATTIFGQSSSCVVAMERAEDGEVLSLSGPRSPWESGPSEMIRRPDAWLLWFVIFAIQSGGVVLTSDLGSITESRSGLHVSAASAVATFSCAQSLGRLFGGVLSDRLVVNRGYARPYSFVALLLCMGLAHCLLSISGPAPLYCGVSLAGLAFGCMYPIMIMVIAELFGTERVASNYMVFDGSPSALASVLIAKGLAQYVYQRNGDGSGSCAGDECFRLTHLTVAALQLVAAAAAACLAVRSTPVYESLTDWADTHPSEPAIETAQLCAGTARS